MVEGDFFSIASGHLVGGDLFEAAPTTEASQYDVVLGNPPFIRYQDFPELQRLRAFGIMEAHGLRPSRLTNAWLPFLVISSLLLRRNGRLAMVVPAELLQVNYAAETRSFLSRFFDRITLLTFRRLVFPGTQQEVVLVLAEKDVASAHGIRVVELDNAESLADFSVAEILKSPTKLIDHGLDKWTKYFLSKEELSLLRAIEERDDIAAVRDFMDVDVGLVTGQNDFFVIDQATVDRFDLGQFSERIVARSASLAGLGFEKRDWQENVRRGGRAYLFAPPDVPVRSLPAGARRYIAQGEAAGAHKGYKCRIRRNWYIVPSQWTPDAFVLRQVHTFPKLVVNAARAATTDTIHRVRLTNGMPSQALAAGFVNSLTLAFSETRGRSYGGGVLTFEPTEVEGLPLPARGIRDLPFAKLDRIVRDGQVKTALDMVDDVLLRDGLHLSVKQIKGLRFIWEKLRNRRLARK